MIHMLRQYKEVHYVPRAGERFLLIRKNIWGQGTACHPAPILVKCFRPKALAGQTQREVAGLVVVAPNRY